MGILDRWQANLKNFDIDKEVTDALKMLEDDITDYNTEEQLENQGIGSDGKSLGEYSPRTIEIKRAKGQTTSHVTLRDEGDFHKGFFVRYSKKSFELWSTDSKTDELVRVWGKEIFGLTRENLSDFINVELRDEVIKEVKNYVFK